MKLHGTPIFKFLRDFVVEELINVGIVEVETKRGSEEFG